MKTAELHTLAHQIAYSTARSDIESFAQWHDDRAVLADGHYVLEQVHRWYDLSTIIRDTFARECLARAISYLDARGLLHRKPGEPHMVQILPPLSSGELVPPTLAEARRA